MRIGKYETQIIKRLKYHLHIGGWDKLPKSSWYYPIDGWTCDCDEIKKAIMLDDDFELTDKGR